jgi:radical SAM protein with 4Fe4S-binding SPASM domain
MTPARFTLRREYFGGLVYDAKTAATELLTPSEYEFLAAAAAGRTAPDIDGKRLAAFVRLGFVDDAGSTYPAPRLRAVTPPETIRDGILTAPIRIFDSFTRRCNFNCDQCYFSSSAMVTETRRTPQQTADIIRKFYEAGTMEWRFTGGEALLYPDLFDAIAVAKGYGMNVGIYTNGWWAESTPEKIFASGIDEIAISLEGNRDVNDRRRRAGAYDRALETISRIAAHNAAHPDRAINGVLAAAVGRDNVADILHVARVGAEYGFDVNFMPLKPSGRARYTLTGEMLDTAEYAKFAAAVQAVREDPAVASSGISVGLKYKDLYCPSYRDKTGLPFPFDYSECGALTTYLSMMPDGQVFSCPFVLDVDPDGKYLGPNMTGTSVAEAWNCANFEAYRHAEKVGCGDCRFYRRQCRGKCRATVLGFGGKIEEGRLTGDDPQCFARMMTPR